MGGALGMIKGVLRFHGPRKRKSKNSHMDEGCAW